MVVNGQESRERNPVKRLDCHAGRSSCNSQKLCYNVLCYYIVSSTGKMSMNFFRSISAKILVPVIVMTVLLVAVTVTVSTYTFNQFVEVVVEKEIKIFASSLTQDITMQQNIASDQVVGLAGNASMIAALKEGNRDQIRDVITDFKSAQRCTFFTILDAEGNVIFMTANPEQVGDSQTSLLSVREVLTQRKSVVCFESTPNIQMAIRAAAPVFDENDTLLGIVTGGFRLDTDDWVDRVQELYGIECTVFAGETRVATTVKNPETGKRGIGTPLNNPEISEIIFNQRKAFFGSAMVLGRPVQAFYKPLLNEGEDKPVGMFFIGVPLQLQIDMVRQSMLTNTTITFIGLLVFGGILIWIIRAIAVPIRTTAEGTKYFAETGDMSYEIPAEFLRRKDEVGDMSRGIGMMFKEFRDTAKMAKDLASNDWRHDVSTRGDLDTMNQDINTMMDCVNHTLLEINENVNRVSTSSDEISSASQNLAAGTQKAAASLEEITASMSEISSQIRLNAENAAQARDLAQEASKVAIGGQGAMRKMTGSMERITQNSSEIQRVIKVIDDIAFQTNLLALNAAVEAARAGQHGKGFAVVAEEVRNLAARSAKAAKETSELISRSGQEIEKGGGDSAKTAEMLNTIVEQIKQTTDIVAGIAVASKEQASGVEQVTIGLQQIDSVVQQNTAATEESASATAEMHAMIANLKRLVGQFKLRKA